MKETTLTFTVNGQTLAFCPTMTAYNGFINDVMPSNKVAPAHNYLRRIVAPDSREALDALLEQPGVALQLAAKVNEHYAPELDIDIKN